MTTTEVPRTPTRRSRLLREARAVVDGLPVPLVVVYLVSTTTGLMAFAQGDIHWTVNASYAYLTGHVTDFYDYNLATVGGADYFPTVYLIFALWMAPVKLLLGTDANPGGFVTPVETAWAKLLLVLLFWATAWLVSRIARELFTAERARQVATLAYLLSPFAAFAVVIFGQYDVFGVFFTLLGFLALLRGEKWRFALFFALAASCKYFALVIFAPLLVLAFKRVRDIAALSVVALSVLAVQSLLYIGSPAFRSRTLLGGLATGKVADAGQNQITLLLGVLFLAGLWGLWRYRPTPAQFGEIAVHASALAYGFMLLAVVWNPQWFMILTPFYALSAAYLRRPAWFLLWESGAFMAFVWYVVNRSPGNVDATMILGSPLRETLGTPRVLLGSFYSFSGMTGAQVILIAFLVSPTVFAILERLSSGRIDQVPVRPWVWTVRALTPALVFMIPALLTARIPMPVAERLDPGAGTYGSYREQVCGIGDTAYGEIHDGVIVRQTLALDEGDLLALSIKVGTYGRVVPGSIALRLLDADGAELAASTTDLSGVADNAAVYLKPAAPLRLPSGSTFTLEIATTGVPEGDGVALWGLTDDCIQPGELRIAEGVASGDLSLVIYRPGS